MRPLDTPMPWEMDDAVSQRAAEFFQRQKFWEWGEADQAEFDAWLAEAPGHLAAYLRVRGIVAHTDRLVAAAPLEFGRGVPNGRVNILPRGFLVPLLIAASIAALAAAGIPLANYFKQTPDRAFSTDVGGRTLVKFADGTEIELNTDTAMRFRMTSAERTVWLEKGEAWFRVAHNAQNPFTVVIGKHRVTDLGTEFVIRRGANAMEVALVSGRAMLNTEGTPTTMLVPGDEATATQVSVAVTRKSQQELADELAWRHGELVFRKTRLAQVVREFNRYNQTKLVIADSSIANVKITADLKTDDYESFLRLAETALNLRADREGSIIMISRDETKKVVRTHGRAGTP